MFVEIDGTHFKDPKGRYFICPRSCSNTRVLTLRGVNLGSDAKNPTKPFMPSHIKDGLFDADDVSFVGAPFPLKDADEHLGRIKGYGFNVVRFVFSWEALEHSGPYVSRHLGNGTKRIEASTTKSILTMSFKYYVNVSNMEFWYLWIHIRILYFLALPNKGKLTRDNSGRDFQEAQVHHCGR